MGRSLVTEEDYLLTLSVARTWEQKARTLAGTFPTSDATGYLMDMAGHFGRLMLEEAGLGQKEGEATP